MKIKFYLFGTFLYPLCLYITVRFSALTLLIEITLRFWRLITWQQLRVSGERDCQAATTTWRGRRSQRRAGRWECWTQAGGKLTIIILLLWL